MTAKNLNISLFSTYLIPISIFAAIILAAIFVIIPKIQESLSFRDQIPQKKEQLTQIVAKRQLLESVNTGESTVLLREAELAIPTEKDPTSVLVALENLKFITNYSVENVNFAPGLVSSVSAVRRSEIAAEVLHKNVPALAIEVGTQGTIDQFLAFIDKLFSSRRLFDLSSIEFSYPNTDEDFITSTLTIYTFYQPEVEEITDVLTPLPQITNPELTALRKLATMEVISETLLSGSSVPESLINKSNLFESE